MRGNLDCRALLVHKPASELKEGDGEGLPHFLVGADRNPKLIAWGTIRRYHQGSVPLFISDRGGWAPPALEFRVGAGWE